MNKQQQEAIDQYRHLFRPVNMANADPPSWVIHGLLVPGLNLLVGPPKTFKSRLALQMIASMLEQIPVGDPKHKRFRKEPGSVVYFAGEQSIRRIKYIYERDVIHKQMQAKTKDWSFIMPIEPWDWRFDKPMSVEHDFATFIKVWRPTITILDPMVNFHDMDENDPGIVRFLLPLKKAAQEYGGAVVIVHHLRKKQGDPRGSVPMTRSFDEIRGTGALWGAADGAHMLHKTANGLINISSEFKDFPATNWTWRPPVNNGG